MNTEKILEANYNIACRTGLHCAPLGHEQLGTAKIHGSAITKKIIKPLRRGL